MPQYTVKDNETGKTITFDWHSDTPPTDADMADVFAASKEGRSVSPSFAGKELAFRQAPSKLASGITQHALPLLGTLLGGLIGSAGGPAGTAAGAGLGGAGFAGLGDANERLMGYRRPNTLGEVAARTAMDIPTYAGYEAGGQILSKLASLGAGKAAQSAKSFVSPVDPARYENRPDSEMRRFECAHEAETGSSV